MAITMDEEALVQAKEYTEQMKTEIDESFLQLQELLEEIGTTGAWQGTAQQAFMAYMDLVKQYHQCFTIYGVVNPVEMMLQAYRNAESRSEVFYDEFEEYRRIRDIE